jgi:transcriptional regulator with PAS, ATPase and Fis domain
MSDLVLRILHHDGTEEVKDLVPGDLTIGRGADNWLCPLDPALSRSHAVIRGAPAQPVIEDLGSGNGTHVNGSPVDGATPLGPGDVVEVGTTRITVAAAAGSVETRRSDATLEIESGARGERIIAESRLMTDLLDQADRFARGDLPILITGETGTGKELLARRIHRESRRREAPLIILNCPALAPGVIESELFGIEGGVATDVRARPGRLEEAHGGTLLLDEVADLGLEVQAKLLRFLADGAIEPVGGRAAKNVDVRLLAATNQDLEAAMESGRFRRDLFYRIAAVHLHLPPLRQRPQDLPALVDHLLRRRDAGHLRVDDEARAALAAHDFPGNVRELDAIISRAAVLVDGDTIRLQHLALQPQRSATRGMEAMGPNEVIDALAAGSADFWRDLHAPFIGRELPRTTLRGIVARGLERSGGSLKELAALLGVGKDYRKLVDFLRNNRLLP